MISLCNLRILVIFVYKVADCTFCFEEVNRFAQVKFQPYEFNQSFNLLTQAVVESFYIIQPLIKLEHLMAIID